MFSLLNAQDKKTDIRVGFFMVRKSAMPLLQEQIAAMVARDHQNRECQSADC
jgi:hypothetical protein